MRGDLKRHSLIKQDVLPDLPTASLIDGIEPETDEGDENADHWARGHQQS